MREQTEAEHKQDEVAVCSLAFSFDPCRWANASEEAGSPSGFMTPAGTSDGNCG